MKIFNYKSYFLILLLFLIHTTSYSSTCTSYFDNISEAKILTLDNLKKLAALTESEVQTYRHITTGNTISITYDNNIAIEKPKSTGEQMRIILGKTEEDTHTYEKSGIDITKYADIRSALEFLETNTLFIYLSPKDILFYDNTEEVTFYRILSLVKQLKLGRSSINIEATKNEFSIISKIRLVNK